MITAEDDWVWMRGESETLNNERDIVGDNTKRQNEQTRKPTETY